jgi:WD40 repeat protein
VTPTCVTGVTGVSDLPADALELTFAFLPPRALASAGATCRAWREVATRERLWARLLARRRGADDTSTFCDTNSLAETFSLESRWRAGKYARHDLHRHTWTVERVELVDTKSHGRVVVTGGWDGAAFAWRLRRIPTNENGKNGKNGKNGTRSSAVWEPFRAFSGPSGGAWVSALDATPSLVAAGDTNGRVWVWGYDATAPRRAWRHGGSVTTTRFARGSRSRAFDGDAKKEKESATIGSSSEKKAAGSEKKEEEEAFVASASTDGDVKVWCVATGAPLATLRGHADVCWHVRFVAPLRDADAAFAVTAGRDGLAKTWRVPLRASPAANLDASLDTSSSPGTTNDAVSVPGEEAEEAATAYPRDALSCESTLRGHDDAILAVATWDPDPRRKEGDRSPLLATCGADGVVVVWRVENGAKVATLRGHAHGVLCASFVSWDDRLRLVTGSADQTVRVWDVATGACLGAIADHGAPVTDVKTRADALATVAPGDGVMTYWRLVDDADDADDASRHGESESNKRALPLGLRASATLMDGAGSGFSACLAMDRRMLAVGTKTGAVQVLDFMDFRRHAA